MIQWRTHPVAWRMVRDLLSQMMQENETLADLQERMRAHTGTRLVDWLDHLSLTTDDVDPERLQHVGYHFDDRWACWLHLAGLFPRIRLADPSSAQRGVAIKVDSIEDFQACQKELYTSMADADAALPLTAFRMQQVNQHPQALLSIVERHGHPGFRTVQHEPQDPKRIQRLRSRFENRSREFSRQSPFAEARRLYDEVATEVGRSWSTDLFFAAERAYWQSRNRAARIQYDRQNRLGLGWANHDHHTYRSSREHFRELIETLEYLGLVCRERFYAGAEAGWGAQVLEHPQSGIVVFADVDLSPTEVSDDFAHAGLPPRDRLGTVGLWCRLHGESFVEAGMHHLECQFDFDAARQQLKDCGIETMPPFTNFEFLTQAFTEGERWAVSPQRLEDLVQGRVITPEQASEFASHGALGSHLEILERNEGYKGFNQTGVSDIIRRTDPRRT